MSRINLKIFKLSWWQWLLMIVFVWLIFVIWPVKGFLLPGNWWGNSLIVVMNDNEARPCGGFATAYGVLKLPLFSLDVGSTYELDADLGPAPEPLTMVTDRLKFWDLGTSINLNECAADFKSGYFTNTEKDVDRVILMQMSFLENWAKMLGNDTFFADISRQVANVDHHDEASLETRKDPAGELISSLIRQTLLNPFQWRQVAQLINEAEDNHYLFVQGKTKFVALGPNTISIAEWNLGGGKSSRYLRKNWSVELGEHVSNKSIVRLSVDHLADYDAPLSQAWVGGFSLNIMGDEGESSFIPAEAGGGGPQFYRDNVFYFEIKEHNTVSIYAPSYQNWQTQASVSVFAQQTLESRILDIKESIGTWFGKLPAGGLNIDWEILPDETAPFLTLHKPLDANALDEAILNELSWTEGDLIVELQFSEAIDLQNLQAELQDRNHTVLEITENPQLKGFNLLDNQTTLLLNWSQEQYQKDERFYLTLDGIEDVWGNKYVNAPRTVITR